MTKLAIHKQTCNGQIVTDAEAELMIDTHRIVDAKFSHSDSFGGTHYIDVWGGTWRVSKAADDTECTVGAMDRWS